MDARKKALISNRRTNGLGLQAPKAPLLALVGHLEKDRVLGPVLVAPAVLILAVFVAYPFAYGVWLSLTNTFVGRLGRFVGLANFVAQFKDDVFRRAIFNTFEYTFVSCALRFAFGLALAVVLNGEYPLRRFVRALVLLPWIVPTALSTLAWLWMFDSTFSVFNWGLSLVGLRGPVWLGAGHWAMLSIILVSTWRGTPFFGICFLAGMQTIPEELYEAAKIDGTNAWQRFWHITFPLLMPVTTVVTLLSVVLTFGDFELIYVLTRGGPANATQVFSTQAYFIGIGAGRLGAGASIALTMFPVLLIGIYITLKALRRN